MICQRSLICLLAALFYGCQTTPKSGTETPRNTLEEVDLIGNQDGNRQVFVKPKSKEEIRQAYTDYLNQARADEASRLDALTRLAELEYSGGDTLLLRDQVSDDEAGDSAEYRLYSERLQRSITLLRTSLRDFPDAEGNDSLLYQLAKAQAQIGQYEESIDNLKRLVEKYPRSRYFVEAQFRIAEDAFSLQDYSVAEYAYSEVILALDNDIFYEKALFKRGWARFKQQFYSDAIDDFIQAVVHHEFGPFETLDAAEKEQFNEFFRAIALAFSYQNDAAELASYFRNRPNFRYTYHTYRMISDLFLQQERYSDAVDIQRQFIRHFQTSENIPYAYLKIIEIWKNGGFEKQIYRAIDDFYVNYNPASDYWVNQNENSKVNRVIRRSLREYLVLMTGHYHSRFQSGGKREDFVNADRWYRRYLEFYQAYARQDNVFFLYAELLTQARQPQRALGFFEQAAFDNELILHQEAVYAAISISDELYRASGDASYLDKILTYSQRFSREYPQDPRSRRLAQYAAEQALGAKNYRATIELADLALGAAGAGDDYLDELRGSAYLALREFEEAERIFRGLLDSGELDATRRAGFADNLALAIYRQAEEAQQNGDPVASIRHFSRISALVPRSGIAATGLYDAIALNMQNQQWSAAIELIERFQRLYPQHRLRADVSKKLSVAYLSSNQGIKAAREFEKLARLDDDYEVRAAALWKAAELYEEKNRSDDALEAYRNYASNFDKPFTRKLEAMHKVAAIHLQKVAGDNSRDWYRKIILADEKALNNVRTDRSRYIVSNAYLQLARHQKNRFDQIRLTLPLNKSLRKKKTAMQKSVQLFGKASANKNYEITTEATYSIARIYRDFSQALLQSDRPSNLTEDELDQYEILLEDQAFPFEDKSIEFFEINLRRIKDGQYNDWIRQSHRELIDLFPVRYDRKPKQDDYIAILE